MEYHLWALNDFYSLVKIQADKVRGVNNGGSLILPRRPLIPDYAYYQIEAVEGKLIAAFEKFCAKLRKMIENMDF